MARYVLKELSRSMSGGKRIVYPKLRTHSMQDYKSVLRKMHSYSGAFTQGEMMGVLDALINTMASWMPEGHSLKIDGLGVFSLALGFANEGGGMQRSPGAGTTVEAGERKRFGRVCIKGINFRPDAHLLSLMNRHASFEHTEGPVQVPRRSALSQAARLEAARRIIAANGRMTLGEYAAATGLERSVASRELKRLVADPSSGLRERGTYSHKVWVADE